MVDGGWGGERAADELPSLPLRIGYDRRRIVRSAVVFLALATIAGLVLAGVMRARPSGLGQLVGSRYVGPVPLPLALVEGVALLVVVVTVGGALGRRDFLILCEEG